MVYDFKPVGVCSRNIHIEIDDDSELITDVKFTGGCNGNLQGIAALSIGKSMPELIERLKGIDCNGRGTSCPDQFATALEQILEEF